MANALAQALRDWHLGSGEAALTLGTGMAAQLPAGIGGLAELLRSGSGASAADKVRELSERYTYAPRSDVGRRGVENIGHAIESVTEPIAEYTVDPIGERSPALGAAILAAANVVGPKGAKKPKAHTPRFDPGSPQQLIHGIEPLSLADAHARALREYDAARNAMSFEDLNSGLQFDYDPNWRGGGETYEMNYREPAEIERSAGGKRPVNRVSQRPIPVAALEAPSSRTVPEGDLFSHGTVQAEVGGKNFQRMMANIERLRAAEGEAHGLGEQSMQEHSRELGQQIARRRALAAEPGINADQRRALEEEILNLMRRRPIDVNGGMLGPTPSGAGMFSPMSWRDVLGVERTDEARSFLRERPGMLDAQKRLVRRLRGEPEHIETTPRRPPEGYTTLADLATRDPNAMNREAVNAFLKATAENPALLKYGVMPPRSVRSLEDFAEHFSKQSGEPLRVEWDYADSDEPYKIKRAKEHGRGEVMRDRYGDYKMETADPGQIKYDDYGNPVTKEKEVELVGPPLKGESELIGTKEVKKKVPVGEYYRDESGDWVYRKSRGGEQMRDERGNIKYEEVENPDYSGSEIDKARLHGPSGYIDITYGDPALITSTEARAKNKGKSAKGQAGQLLYQTALAHASRQGIDIGSEGLTGVNKYRLLSNTLSNIARTGVNTRDLREASSGRASRPAARGAEGPEVWRAEAEEGRQRLLRGGVDPDRVRFDPERGFSIDGKPASGRDIERQMAELSPHAGASRGEDISGVGQKSLMRNAVFEWLRNASPDQAARAAAKWPKEWGPIFAGVGGASLDLGAITGGEQERAD